MFAYSFKYGMSKNIKLYCIHRSKNGILTMAEGLQKTKKAHYIRMTIEYSGKGRVNKLLYPIHIMEEVVPWRLKVWTLLKLSLAKEVWLQCKATNQSSFWFASCLGAWKCEVDVPDNRPLCILSIIPSSTLCKCTETIVSSMKRVWLSWWWFQ